MRAELLQYIHGRVEDGVHSGDMEPQSALMFAYRTLADELVLGGVYIKHFLADPAMALDDPYLLCHDLLQVCACLCCEFGVFILFCWGPIVCVWVFFLPRLHVHPPVVVVLRVLACSQQIAISPANPRCIATPEGVRPVEPGPPIRHMKHLCQCLRALHMLVIANPSVEDEITGRAKPYLAPLIHLVEASEATAQTEDRGPGAGAGAGGARSTVSDESASVLELALGVVSAIAPHPGASSAMAELNLLPPLLRVLPKDPIAIGPIMRTLFVHSRVIEQVGAP